MPSLILRALAPALLLIATRAEAQWCPFTGPEFAPASIGASARLAPSKEPGEPLRLSGTVRRADGRTPAAGVILLLYHTDATGRYPHRGDTSTLTRRTSALRGWVRTGADGRYAVETIRPRAYPSGREPAHVHIEVLPPGGVPCEIDPVEFDDDPILSPALRSKRPGYGGMGIVRPLRRADGVWHAQRDIVLWPDTLTVPLRVVAAESELRWMGTKLGGRGRHEGTIALRPDTLHMGGASLLRGTLRFRLESLAITDIPRWDPVPRRALRERLLGATMFDVARFPEAVLDVQRAVRISPGQLQVHARLTIRGSTRDIRFGAMVLPPSENSAAMQARFTINRHHFGLAYRGSELANDLIDDDIRFDVRLVARDARR
jgi:protocatechuate 3,4-dioxygenase beta subunit